MENLSEHEQLFAEKISKPILLEIGKVKDDVIILKNNHKWIMTIAGIFSAIISGGITWGFK